MSDLIYRQGAIAAHCELCQDQHICCPVRNGNVCKDIEAFKMIPSAQPERQPPTEDDYAYCAECNSVEMCRWYPLYGCQFRSLPSAQPYDRLKKIADLMEGTIDHFDRDDAMDLLYQIKEVLKND